MEAVILAISRMIYFTILNLRFPSIRLPMVLELIECYPIDRLLLNQK